MQGNYDFAYTWDVKPSLEEIVKLGDAVQHALKGSKAYFKMETV